MTRVAILLALLPLAAPAGAAVAEAERRGARLRLATAAAAAEVDLARYRLRVLERHGLLTAERRDGGVRAAGYDPGVRARRRAGGGAGRVPVTASLRPATPRTARPRCVARPPRAARNGTAPGAGIAPGRARAVRQRHSG